MNNKERATMQQALGALVRAEAMYGQPNADIQAALREALEQPVIQEPVAWMSPNKERLEFSRKDTVYGSHTIPLYTAPQSVKEVELTDREIEILMYDFDKADDLGFARAVIAAHKEKNK